MGPALALIVVVYRNSCPPENEIIRSVTVDFYSGRQWNCLQAGLTALTNKPHGPLGKLTSGEYQAQVITRHERKAGVLMSYAEYRRRINPSKRTIRGLYAGAPKFETDELDFQRDRDTGRDIRL